MTGCETIREELSAYLDGELPAAGEAEVREHLAGCESCRSEHESLVRLGRQVESLPRITAPGHFTAQVMARVIEERAPRTAPAQPRRAPSARIPAAATQVAPPTPPGCASDEELSTLVDDQLPVEQSARVRTHLPGCERCRAVHEGFVQLRARLQALPRLPMPYGFPTRVLEAIELWERDEERRRETQRALRARWWTNASWVAQAAGILLLIGVGASLSTPERKQVAFYPGHVHVRDVHPPQPRVSESKDVPPPDEPPPLPTDHEARVELSTTVDMEAAATAARAVILRHATQWEDRETEKVWSGYMHVPANQVDDLLRELVATPEIEGVAREVDELLARTSTELDRVELKSGHVIVGRLQARKGGGVALQVGPLAYELPERDVLRVEHAGDTRRIRIELRGRD